MAGAAGRSGRRPKPVAKKQLAGNPGKRKLNVDQPDYQTLTNVFCPDWMGDYGKQLWEVLAPQLCSERILAITDIQNLEVYCNAYDQFRRAQEELLKNGPTVTGAMGGLIKNPAATVMKEATATMATFGGLLGLDPSSRQRLTGATKKANQNPFSNLLT